MSWRQIVEMNILDNSSKHQLLFWDRSSSFALRSSTSPPSLSVCRRPSVQPIVKQNQHEEERLLDGWAENSRRVSEFCC